jgi:hypothetical protein
MNTTTTTITNAATGAIITVTKVHRVANHWPAVFAAVALLLICSGIYLLVRKDKPSRTIR